MDNRFGHFSRRRFLAAFGTTLIGATALAACAPAPAPTPAPAKPTEAPKAAAPAAAPTTAPAAAPAKPTEAPKPTAAAETKPAAGTGKLIAWGQQSFTPEGDALLTQQFADFGKANNVSVEYVIVENKMVTQKIAAAIEAKATSDVQMLGGASDVQFYGSKNLLVDLTDLWNVTSKQSGGFFDSVLDVYKAGGKYLGIPFETHSFPLFTRLDLMEKATGKKEPPKTLDEMYEASKKILASDKIAPIGLCVGRTADTTDNFINLMWCDGATYVDKNMKPTIKSDGTLTLLKRYQQWFKEKLIPADAIGWDDTGNNNAYQAKQTAFVINPPSPYDWLQKNDTKLLANTTMAADSGGQGRQLLHRRLVVVVGLHQHEERRYGQELHPVPDGAGPTPGGLREDRRALVPGSQGPAEEGVLDVAAALQVLPRPHQRRALLHLSGAAGPEPDAGARRGRPALRHRRHGPGRPRQEQDARGGDRRGAEGVRGDLQEVQRRSVASAPPAERNPPSPRGRGFLSA